uniref:NADH-ubiquinone oxidoreductase chain 6 n=1 Tax=Cucujoidea sp. 41 KM-2017 TaxID=2219380 RepID=A0A346RHX1_9CUCU|nr:NADH dehydrogenase subunit 6 [Cucujoidea sp. 41 KM-2017]
MMMMISMMILSSIFLFLNHPLSFGGILFLQTLLTSFSMGLMMYNFWYSYILFLIMVGGMLILFLYMTSIASNEKFQFSMKILLMFISMLTMMLILTYYYKNHIPFYNFMMDSLNQNNFHYLELNINKYLNYPNNMIFILTIMYLFITLIAVVKITGTNLGPLRQKF